MTHHQFEVGLAALPGRGDEAGVGDSEGLAPGWSEGDGVAATGPPGGCDTTGWPVGGLTTGLGDGVGERRLSVRFTVMPVIAGSVDPLAVWVAVRVWLPESSLTTKVVLNLPAESTLAVATRFEPTAIETVEQPPPVGQKPVPKTFAVWPLATWLGATST